MEIEKEEETNIEEIIDIDDLDLIEEVKKALNDKLHNNQENIKINIEDL